MKKMLYLIGGTMGVGKTAVSKQLQKDLPNSVFLDGDWCWDAHPFQVTEETKAMVIDNICHVLNNFLACSAYENIIFCWVMHVQNIIDTILNNLHTENVRIRCISLLVDETALRNRISKDVERGIRTVDVLERSLARLPLYQKLNTIKIDTTGKSIQEVVQEITK